MVKENLDDFISIGASYPIAPMRMIFNLPQSENDVFAGFQVGRSDEG